MQEKLQTLKSAALLHKTGTGAFDARECQQSELLSTKKSPDLLHGSETNCLQRTDDHMPKLWTRLRRLDLVEQLQQFSGAVLYFSSSHPVSEDASNGTAHGIKPVKSADWPVKRDRLLESLNGVRCREFFDAPIMFPYVNLGS